MESRLSILVFVGGLATYILPMLALNQFSVQDERRGMQIQATPQGERRVALVIGNSAYKDAPLPNPVNDARAMARALREVGFEVLYGENLSQNNIKRNIRAFGEKIRDGAVGLFYYAGHGVQIEGSNYLIPVGATINSEDEVEYESVDVGLVLAQMATARNRLNIVILDACRNNPFARSFRSAQRGLASIDAPSGTLIAYATAPGSVASDGPGSNGLYTQELLKYLKQPGLSILQIFMKVRAAVRSRTEGKQVPWESSSLEGDFYFSTRAEASNRDNNNSPTIDTAAVEVNFWESINNSSDAEDYKEYLAKYPSGIFAGLARNKIKNLEASAKNTPSTKPSTVEAKDVGPSSVGAAAPLSSRAFEFDTVTVNAGGNVTSSRKGRAQYFTEVINGVGLEMVEIPGGQFLMGSPDSEADRSVNEGPQHQVSVSTFYMGKYEVTQAQWRAVASLPKVKKDLNPDPSAFKDDNLPIDSVTWKDAVEFCERLSKATGRQYRLPSEAEWEYACRAGTTTPFSFGDTITPELANYNGNYPYGGAPKGAYRQQTVPVGETGVANPFGLFDIHGNVWEWCLDTWHDSYKGAPGNGKAWEGGETQYRVLRGGSWFSYGYNSRAAYRLRNSADLRSYHYGFRVALTAVVR